MRRTCISLYCQKEHRRHLIKLPMNFVMSFQLLNSSNSTSPMVIILKESASGGGKRWENNYDDAASNMFCFLKVGHAFPRTTYFHHNRASCIGLDTYKPPTSSKFHLNENINPVFSCHFEHCRAVGVVVTDPS